MIELVKEYWFINEEFYKYVGHGRVDKDIYVYDGKKKISKFIDLVNLSDGMCSNNMERIVIFLNMKRKEYRGCYEYTFRKEGHVIIDNDEYIIKDITKEMDEMYIPPVKPILSEDHKNMFKKLNGREPIVAYNHEREDFWIYTNSKPEWHCVAVEFMDPVVEYSNILYAFRNIDTDDNNMFYGIILNIIDNGDGIPPEEYISSDMDHDEEKTADDIKEWIIDNNITGNMETIMCHGSYYHTPIAYLEHILISKGLKNKSDPIRISLTQVEKELDILEAEFLKLKDKRDDLRKQL